jgi:hypothetical protein
MSRGFSFGESQTLDCPLLAQSGQSDRARLCPLLDQTGQNQILARAESARRRYAILDYASLSAGLAHHRRLIVASWRVKRHVEPVPTIDCDNRQGKLRQFGLAELLTC